MDNQENKIFLECSCKGEVVLIEYDEELNIFYLCTYETSGNRSWKNKFRQMWYILKYGHPYSDRVVLEEPQIDAMMQFIKNKTK